MFALRVLRQITNNYLKEFKNIKINIKYVFLSLYQFIKLIYIVYFSRISLPFFYIIRNTWFTI